MSQISENDLTIDEVNRQISQLLQLLNELRVDRKEWFRLCRFIEDIREFPPVYNGVVDLWQELTDSRKMINAIKQYSKPSSSNRERQWRQSAKELADTNVKCKTTALEVSQRVEVIIRLMKDSNWYSDDIALFERLKRAADKNPLAIVDIHCRAVQKAKTFQRFLNPPHSPVQPSQPPEKWFSHAEAFALLGNPETDKKRQSRIMADLRAQAGDLIKSKKDKRIYKYELITWRRFAHLIKRSGGAKAWLEDPSQIEATKQQIRQQHLQRMRGGFPKDSSGTSISRR
ncbi:MAG TPA: hypothetical protein VGG19_11985 [Tepidisphaeraceae bacterium]|jgi:hypothetical protein